MAGKFIDVTLRLIDKMSAPLKQAGGTLTKSSKQMIRAGKEIEKAGKSIEKAGIGMTKTLTVPIATVGVACTKLASDFEAGMSKVQSIAGASSEDIGKLAEKAKEMGISYKEGANDTETAMNILAEKAKQMGARTKYSATEATEAFSYMAMAGWDVGEMMDGIEGIMYLAGATGEDLAQTSDIVTDALTAFGMTAGDTQKFVDVLAQAANKSNTDVAMLGESFKYVAPVAGALKYSIEDTSVALGLMANNGVKASNAGTALRSWLTRMAKPTKQSQKAMDKLGLSLVDSSGNMKDFSVVMSETRGAFAKLTEAERSEYAALLAGQTGMSGLLAIVNSSESDFAELTEGINNSTDACKEMYDVANDNLQGQLTILKSTLESIAISFGERLIPYVKKATEWLQNLAEKFNGLSDAQKDTIIKIAGIIAVIGPATLIFGRLTRTIGSSIIAVGKFGKYLPTLTTNFGKASQIIRAIDFMPPGIGKIGNVFGKLGGKLIAPFKMLSSGLAILGRHFPILPAIARIFLKLPLILTKLPLKMFGGAIGKLLSPLKQLGGVFGGVGKAMFTVLGPSGTVVAVLGAIAIAGVLVYKNWDKIKETAQKVFSFVGKTFESLGVTSDSLKEKLMPIGAQFIEIKDKIAEFWTLAEPYVQKFGEVASTVFSGVLGGAIGGAIGYFQSLLDTATSMIGSIMSVFSGLIDFISGVFTGNWGEAWEGVKTIFSGAFEALTTICKAPINAVIGIINGAISGINNVGIKIPDWVPAIGGKDFSINIPKIPALAVGTPNWGGGIAQISEKGGEIVDLPKGSRIYPHDESVKRAFNDGVKSGTKSNNTRNDNAKNTAKSNKAISITIAKLADQIVVREEADIDKLAQKLADKLEKVSQNLGGEELGYLY